MIEDGYLINTGRHALEAGACPFDARGCTGKAVKQAQAPQKEMNRACSYFLSLHSKIHVVNSNCTVNKRLQLTLHVST